MILKPARTRGAAISGKYKPYQCFKEVDIGEGLGRESGEGVAVHLSC